MSPGRKRSDEAAMGARLLAHRLAEWEGHVCACEHLQPDHWDAGVGRCGVADCDCKAYDEDTFGAELKRVKQQPAVNERRRSYRPGKVDQKMRDALRALGGDLRDLG
jgi:hypothetical protein